MLVPPRVRARPVCGHARRVGEVLRLRRARRRRRGVLPVHGRARVVVYSPRVVDRFVRVFVRVRSPRPSRRVRVPSLRGRAGVVPVRARELRVVRVERRAVRGRDGVRRDAIGVELVGSRRERRGRRAGWRPRPHDAVEGVVRGPEVRIEGRRVEGRRGKSGKLGPGRGRGRRRIDGGGGSSTLRRGRRVEQPTRADSPDAGDDRGARRARRGGAADDHARRPGVRPRSDLFARREPDGVEQRRHRPADAADAG
mmetsp:Transcript_7240/g.31947  ORF Transcript_7240/g.31947 Transcript_7240/m.31947 type:complete len:254 (-) Transcript_7240:376-1137(-)